MPETHAALGREAILRTSMGDVHIKLFPAECPRTVENFWYARLADSFACLVPRMLIVRVLYRVFTVCTHVRATTTSAFSTA
jgi:cyclophilin family peptidyl-prolyl cis-trans isomerase